MLRTHKNTPHSNALASRPCSGDLPMPAPSIGEFIYACEFSSAACKKSIAFCSKL